ncbi:cytochrome c [Pseudomonas asuensis]|uniref:Cytochrome c n=2 Tax=Pseudomonas asuensis TaxID=1825787 RepID=A0ABQ2GVY0_9PSED|nr:cytochrome c [Pseudomonas asuensis]
MVVVFGGVSAFLLMWRPAIEPVELPQHFDSEQLLRGARVVEAGDCAVCHTRPGGKYLAGGLGLVTPFGTLYSTNITPDPDTGIGRWSLPAFERAMRQGISRDGHFLYPAFPYVHYSRMTDEDIRDAYMYLISGPGVHAPATPNQMNFPMNIRPLVSFWNLLFLHSDRITALPDKSQTWNRGKYLVEGAGHCAGCHTPLNALGAEKSGQSLAGGVVDGWEAPSLRGMSSGPRPWTSEQLVGYLRAQVVPNHGTPAGPMRPVSLGLARLPLADVEAIADYLLSLQAPAATRSKESSKMTPIAAQQAAGLALFQGSCAGCHAPGAAMRTIDARPGLEQTSALHATSPRNFLKTVMEGIAPVPGMPGPVMPAFSASLSDDQLEALAAYLREQTQPDEPWTDLSSTIHDLRQEAK